MNLQDPVPFVLRHVEHHAVSEDTGQVDQDVDPAVVVERDLDDLSRRVVLGNRVVRRDRGAARVSDLLDDDVGRAAGRLGAVHGHAQVVYHDRRALLGQLESHPSPDAPAGAGYYGHSTF